MDGNPRTFLRAARVTWAGHCALTGILLCAVLACGGDGARRSQGSGEGRPDILLITVDTLRPDALGWVAGRTPTPSIDTLADEGFRTASAVSPVPLTLPAHASLLTGLLPRRHGARDNGQMAGEELETLAEVLGSQGWSTAAVVSGYPLAAEFGLDQGFDHYDDTLTAGEGAWRERPAPAAVSAAVAWLQEASSPWFLWLHLYDPHLPYEPPPELRRPGWRGAYDGEVAAVDRALGELLPVAASRSAGDLLTVFTADHGESLGEHGEASHGYFVYDSSILVPLVLRWPGRVAPLRADAPLRLIDVLPTLLDLLGLAALEGLDGASFAPLLAGETWTPPVAHLETLQPWLSYGWSPLVAARSERFKLIQAPEPELYELRRDPGEERDLLAGDAMGGEARRAVAKLRTALDAVEREPATSAGAVDDPRALARLQALGYIGGAGAAPDSPERLQDPKRMLAVRELLTTADEHLRGGRLEEAVGRFDEALTADPGNRFALARSGVALARLGDAAGAIGRLEEALATLPEQPEVLAVLAETLARAGRHGEAVRRWRQLVELQPRRASAWSNLGASLGSVGHIEEAVEALRRAVELSPDHSGRLARLAFAEYAAGDLVSAASHLEQVAKLAGRDAFPHAGALGLLRLRLGDTEAARRWLERSRRGEPEYAEARFELARLALAAGDREAARRALLEALEEAPALRARAEADAGLRGLLASAGG